MEIWKDIKGYEGLYQVSNLGNIKALGLEYYKRDGKKDIRKEYLMRVQQTNNGYFTVGLRKPNEKVKRFYIHRLVAESFIINPYNYSEVNHINEDKSDNTYCNLEWCNRNYNINYGSRTEKYYKPIEKLDINGNVIEYYQSIKEAEQQGYKAPSIIRSCKKGYKHYGYYWRYAS